MSVLDVEPTTAACLLVQPAEAGEVAQDALVVGPGPARTDHRAVVEADGREGAADPVDDGEPVAIERAEHVLRTDARTGPRWLDTDAQVRNSVDLHQAVRAGAGAA